MNLKSILFMCISLISYYANSQEKKILNLSGEKWNIKPAYYFIAGVIDNRNNKVDAGQALVNNKRVPAVFKNSLETDLKELIDFSIVQDTSKVPLFISFDKLLLSESGTQANHKAVVDFSLKIFRIIDDKKYKIFETNGQPFIEMRGPYNNPHEKIISELLKSTFKSFDEWINKNKDIPPLAKTVKVIFENRSKNISNDTIFWNDDYKLKWSDFKAKPDGSPYMAQSNCAFSMKPVQTVENGILILHLYLNATFDRNTSWVKPGQQFDTLLSHEQLHFDICELYIRKLKKKILESNFNPLEFDSQLQSLFTEAWNEYTQQQQKYDDETKHGIVSDKQKLWRDEVYNQLAN
jgi:hypothetical protein